MKLYKYVKENGHIEWLNGNFKWLSLCHNEDVMDNYPMYLEDNIIGITVKDVYTKQSGWGVCRRCGTPANFVRERINEKAIDISRSIRSIGRGLRTGKDTTNS